jgi:hypothetical protein
MCVPRSTPCSPCFTGISLASNLVNIIFNLQYFFSARRGGSLSWWKGYNLFLSVAFACAILSYFTSTIGKHKLYIWSRAVDDCCNRTDQIIRAQVQKQAPKRSNFRTWAHIIPVVNQNHEGFQTNLLTTRIASFNIQHHTLHFTSSSEISLDIRSRNYYKPSL